MSKDIFINLFKEIFSRKKSSTGGVSRRIGSAVLSKIHNERFSNPEISEFAYISDSAKISNTAYVGPGVYIGENVVVGENSRLFPNCTILDGTIIGSNVTISSGSVIGGEGYGFVRDPTTKELKHIPHIGNVLIEDDVTICSNVSIDRGTLGNTKIGQGTKINNNVMIGHNVQIGKYCLIMSLVSISGSTVIGDYVEINPQAGVAKHIEIGEYSIVGMNSTVLKNVRPNVRVLGTPAKEK